jgi:hypothetical protein
MSLGSGPEIPKHRVRVLADFLGGFQWPGQAGRLTKKQKEAAHKAALMALERLAYEEQEGR